MNFKENKILKSELEAFSRKIVFFLAPILLACIITGSLIHEVMTPMEKNSSSFESVIYQFKLLT